MAHVYEPEFPSGAGAGRAAEHEPERPVAEVLKDIAGNIQEIVRTEVRLARAEIRQRASAIAKAGAVLSAGAVIVFYSLGFLFVTVYNLLGLVMPLWGAALLIFVALGLISGALIGVGVSRIRKINPLPERAVAEAKATVDQATSSARQVAQGTMMDARDTVQAAKKAAVDTVQSVKEEAKWIRDQNR